MSHKLTRREFSAGLLAAGTVAAVQRSTSGVLGANERVRLGIIGVGNRGDQLLNAFKMHDDAQITAICDVYDPYLEFCAHKIGGQPFVTKDYRRLLDRNDIDAVIIATPDHWHALQFVDACRAGKDVFVEKPLSLVVAEGRKMVEVAQETGRITQMGVQRRSSALCRKAAELVAEGAIGQVTAARCSFVRNEWPMGIGNPPDGDPPPGLDWDMFLGPAPERPYNPNRGLYMFRWFRDYSGGQLTNFGTHFLDVIQWVIGKDAPLSVMAAGGKYAVQDNREFPDTQEVLWEYPGGPLVSFSEHSASGGDLYGKPAHIEFRGTKGNLYIHFHRLEITSTPVRTMPLAARGVADRAADNRQDRSTERVIEPFEFQERVLDADHARDFLDGVKTRRPCICPVDVGHRSTVTTLLGNIAFARQKRLEWDADRERFTNDPEANKLLSYEYRAPWKLD